MSRTRSPGYPSLPLTQAIELTKQLHAHDRTNPIDREAAAKNIGYSGITGASAKALADLAHYGLVERAGKGSLRVSQLAVDILYPVSAADRARALEAAATSPDLFSEIRAQFPDGIPSENALRGYLMRKSFATAAIPYVVKSYTETARLFEEGGGNESHGAKEGRGPESASTTAKTSKLTMPPTTEQLMPVAEITPAAIAAATAAIDARNLNRINMNIQGGKVHLNALLDLKGIEDLEKKLTALKVLLEVQNAGQADAIN